MIRLLMDFDRTSRGSIISPSHPYWGFWHELATGEHKVDGKLICEFVEEEKSEPKAETPVKTPRRRRT